MADKRQKPTGGGVGTPKRTPNVLYPDKGKASTIKAGAGGTGNKQLHHPGKKGS